MQCLVLVDFQRDFLETNGKMRVAPSHVEPVIAAANTEIRRATENGTGIIAIGNEFHPLDPLNTFRRGAAVKGTPGAAWDERVIIESAPYFAKWRGSAFCNPALEEYLRQRNVETLTLCGLYASACVTATAKDALRRGFEVNIVADAVADATDEGRERALERLARRGVRIQRLVSDNAS